MGGVDEPYQTGWVSLRSSRGILGVFKHQKGQFGAGHELAVDGVQDNVSIPRFIP